MENIIKKLERNLDFAKKMKEEYGEKIIFDAEHRLSHIAMHDFYNGMEEALEDAINIVKEETK